MTFTRLLQTIFFILWLSITACKDNLPPPATKIVASTAPVSSAETVLSNDYVYTVDADRAVAEAVAIRGSEIIYVGTAEGASKFAGPETGYPVNYNKSEFLFLQAGQQPGSYRHTHEIFPSRRVKKGDRVAEFPVMDIELNTRYEFEGNTYSIDEFMQRSNTTGFLVLKDGKIAYEKYFLGAGESSLFTSFSVGKSITGTLVGLAIGDGLIGSVNDLLVDYLPAYGDSGYANVTIKQALQMSSGVGFVEEYDLGDSDFTHFFNNCLVNSTESFSEIMRSKQLQHPPGSVFNYSTGESTVLSELVHEVSGKTAADYLSEKIWSKIGMESDAWWITDKDGMVLGGGSLSIALRDYARFGLLMLNDGKFEGQQILPQGWVAEATTPDSPQVQPGKLVAGYPLGYQYQWWTFPGDKRHPYLGEGVFGQFLYINPAENIVIVKTSAWPVAWDVNREMEAYALFRSIEKSLH